MPLGQASAELLRATNPIAHVTAAAPPFLILHGTADLLVPPGQSELLHERLVAAGVESTLCLIDGLGHAFLNGDELDRDPRDATIHGHGLPGAPPVTYATIGDFFDRHLRT